MVRKSPGRSEQPSAVELNKISLLDFVRQDQRVRELDLKITADFGYRVRQDETSVGADVAKLQFFGLNTIADVSDALQRHQDHISKLSAYWKPLDDDRDSGSGDSSHQTMPEGISLFYLCHVLAGADLDAAKATEYYLKFSIGSSLDETAEDMGNDLVRFMRTQQTPS